MDGMDEEDDATQDPSGVDEAGEDEQPEVDFDPVRRVLDDFQESQEYYAGVHGLIQEEVEMVLDQEQFEQDLGHTKNQNEIQVKDQSLLSASRRKWSQIAAAPVYINTWGIDQLSDPLASERTKWALEREVYSPRRMFRRKRKRAIMGAVVGRIWYMPFGWNPRLEEISYSTLPPTDVFPTPGFQDVHDPEHPRLILRYQIPVEAARERARFYGQMTEDEILEIREDTKAETDTRPSSTLPGMIRLDTSTSDGGARKAPPGMVTLLVAMYRFDPEVAEVEEILGPPEKLPPEEQFMRCWQCGHETTDHWRDEETGGMPATGDQCPRCLAQAPDAAAAEDVAPMEGVLEVEHYQRYSKHPNGRWIEVIQESRACLYDGDWPYQKPNGDTLRSFPIFQYRVYDDPRNDIPNSDVSWQFNQQLTATFLLQWAVDQVRTSGRVLIFPKNGLVDSRGRNYIPNNRVDSIAWVKDPMVARAVQEFQPRGLPQGWADLYGALTNTFRANLGTGELGLGPEQSKNLPVGTAHAIIESGDIPVDDALQNIRDEDGIGLEVVADMIQCCWSMAKWVRHLGDDGKAAYEYFSGADLCDVDVTISGDPAFDVLQSAKLDRMKTWFEMTPPQQKFSARLLNLEPTMVAQFQQDQMEWLASLPPPTDAGGAPPRTPGSGGAGPRPAAPPRNKPTPRTNLTTESASQLTPELQAGLMSMIQ